MNDELYNEKKSKNSIVKVKKSKVWGGNNTSSESPTDENKKIKIDRNMLSFNTYAGEDEKFQKEEKLPDRIEGTYYYDYNILKIHDILLKKFEQDKNRDLVTLQNKLNAENIKVNGKQNLIERKISRKKIKEIEDEIQKYNLNIDKNSYITKTRGLLDEYKKIGDITTIVSFIGNEVKNKEIICPESEEKQIYRHKIITTYLEIARKYIPIDLIRIFPLNNICVNCGVNFDENCLIEDESGNSVCPSCSLEIINIVKTQFYSDGNRVNNSKNNYEDRANFYKVLLRYQGKQVNKPTAELYDKLDDYFVSRGLLSSKEYNKLPLLEDGTKRGTSREMMFEALSNIGCSGYYDDINLICSVFFGWVLDDLSHLEDVIMSDYDDFKNAIDNLPNVEGRKSSLNSQWTLYVLLKRKGWPCKSTNFKIPSTISILEYHRMKTREAFNVLGWECCF